MDHYCTSTPDSQCLVKTLIWSVCAIFWLLTIINIYMLTGFNRELCRSSSRWTWLSILKLHVILSLIILEMAKSTNLAPIWTSPTILILTHLLSAALIVVHKNKRVHTSGIQLLYWFALSVTHISMFQTTFKEHSALSLILLSSSTLLMLVQSFIFCWSDTLKPPKEFPNNSCPITECSSLNYILFTWTIPLVLKGYKNPLTTTNLWNLIPTLKSNTVFTTFKNHFPDRSTKNRTIYQNIIKPVWFTCRWSLVLAFVCKFVVTLMELLAPKIMGRIMDFVSDKSIETEYGYFWAFTLFFMYAVKTLLLEQFYLQIFKCNANVFTCLNMIIYQKSMCLSSDARRCTTTGEIINLISVDAETIRGMLNHVDKIVSSPIQVCIGIVLLYFEIGISIIPGIVIILATIPLNVHLTTKSSSYQKSQMRIKDKRIKVISEVFSGIQVIKLYAWERSFLNQINSIRDEEVGFLRARALYQCAIQFVINSLPVLVSVVVFFSFVWVGDGMLDAKKAFTCVALFNLISEPIRDFPLSVSACVDGCVSLERVNAFLNKQEGGVQFLPYCESGVAVEVDHGTFAWEVEDWKLDGINFKVPQGSLTGIVGSVASGKSSVLSAILGEMKKCSGTVVVRGRVAYVSQTPWIMNTTVRENICFGLPFDHVRYANVIDCCGLGLDIEMLPAGDLTEIGEKGINLSGGQKQRVSLARAVYSEADVLLLDDVLSAVDSQVGRHIFERVLGNSGVLKGRTRVLCTHSYQFLSRMDQVLVVDRGRVVKQVVDGELLNGCFGNLVSGSQTNQTSTIKLQSNAFDDARRKEKGRLVKDEHVETGRVKISVLVTFLKAMRISLVICFMIAFASSEILNLSRNLVLEKWTSVSKKDNMTMSPRQLTPSTFFLEYSIMGLLQSLFLLLGYVILTISNLNAAVEMHNSMVLRIVHAPMSFFNVTLLGRIINRFSSDVENVDKRIPSLLGDWVVNVCKIGGIITAVSIATNGYLVVFVLPLFVTYFILHRVYSCSLQQLQRMLNTLKSPIYAQFQETFNGSTTVRAYKAEERFMEMMGEKIDNFNQVYFPHWIVRRSLSVILGVLGATFTFIPALFAVIWRDTLEPSMLGLSISYAIQFTSVLSGLVKVTCYLENSFVSVERISEYIGVEQEDCGNEEKGPPENWPRRGVIDFLDYETCYRPGLDPVLKCINFHVGHGEKIGVVGRTGGGKSSLILGLFRIIEATKGRITIDGVNIADVGLQRLRKNLTVIPQNPVLFSRSLRLNLDPFRDYGDDKIWECLEKVHLRSWVEGLEGGLEYLVTETNLSVGQRQLICLARAILRKSKVLILDEATASVDSVTDELIQRAIREEFEGCTVLNVAHRVSSVVGLDRILVIGRGEILEFDTPQNLLGNADSVFYGMARDGGIVLS